jgi:hypothetical protein
MMVGVGGRTADAGVCYSEGRAATGRRSELALDESLVTIEDDVVDEFQLDAGDILSAESCNGLALTWTQQQPVVMGA